MTAAFDSCAPPLSQAEGRAGRSLRGSSFNDERRFWWLLQLPRVMAGRTISKASRKNSVNSQVSFLVSLARFISLAHGPVEPCFGETPLAPNRWRRYSQH